MRKMIHYANLFVKYLKDPANSGWTKFTFFIPFIYLISPIDLLPDILFPFGYLDDLGFLFFCWQIIQRELDKYDMEMRMNRASQNRGEGKKDNVIHLNKDDYKVK